MCNNVIWNSRLPIPHKRHDIVATFYYLIAWCARHLFLINALVREFPEIHHSPFHVSQFCARRRPPPTHTHTPQKQKHKTKKQLNETKTTTKLKQQSTAALAWMFMALEFKKSKKRRILSFSNICSVYGWRDVKGNLRTSKKLKGTPWKSNKSQ